ncbi:hypothetical protein Tco_0968038 [Tanacetum coccineum]
MCILIVPQQNTGFILDSDMEGKNEESYKFPIAVQQSFNSLWSQDVRGDPDSGIGGHWRSSDSGMYKFILILRALAVFRFRRALAVFRFRHAFTKNGIACIYLEGPLHHDFSLMDILPGKSTSYILDSWYSLEGPRTSECTISNGAVEDEILLLNGNAENFASLQPLQSEISRESSFPSDPINAKNLSKNQRHDPTENAINKMLKKNDSTKTKINPH